MSLRLAAYALALLPAVRAHGGIFGPFAFGDNTGRDADLAEPLNSGSGGVDKWFFRGLGPDSASEVLTLQPGGSQDFTVGCSKHNAEDGSNQACNSPTDGALHLKSDGSGSGCGLTISYKAFDQIQPADMKIFSVLHACVQPEKTHTFAIPADLPAGDATCAWHWIPPASSSADEMYMSGFRCRVAGNNGGNVDSAKSALYFAVQGIDSPSERPQYGDLPDGAQQLNNSGAAPAPTSSANSSPSSTAAASAKAPAAQGNAVVSSGNETTTSSGSGKSNSGRCRNGKPKKAKRNHHRRHHAHGGVAADSS